MKLSFRISVLFVFLSVALCTCKKSSPQPAVATATMSFYVDGVEHDMTSVVAISSGDFNLLRINLTGFYQNEGIGITIDPLNWPSNANQPATVEYFTSPALADFYFGGTLGFIYYTGAVVPTQTVVVTNYTSTTIIGTFEFTALNAQNANPTIKNITGGKFSCTITQQ